MARVPVTFLFALLSCLQAPSSGARLPFIIGGSPVKEEGTWPWQGSMQYLNSHYCGCVLLSTTTAVTAAHCIGLPAHEYNIRFGSLSYKRGARVVPTSVKVHEDFARGPGTTPNDIALFTFPELKLTDTIKPIEIAADVDWVGLGECWITGWGYTKVGDHDKLPEMLHEARVKAYTNTQCGDMWKRTIVDTQICVGQDKKGSCNGDSGGPLVCRKTGAENFTLVGVTSWGTGDCDPTYPSVYTRTAKYVDWVKKNSF